MSKKPTAAKAVKPAKSKAKPINPTGSKLEQIAALLTRKEGCTREDILKLTGWKAVSVPAQAKAAGLTLKQEKAGRAFRYFAAA